MYKHRVLIGEEQIQKRVSELAESLHREYGEKTIDIVSILKGSFVFVSDLIRQITSPVRIHFVQVSSYGTGTENSGTLNLHFSSIIDLEGRNVLLVEDILDTGITLDYLLKQLKEQRPTTLKTCILIDKPSRRKINISADYVGFQIPDHFVIGYGLDYREIGRNLKYIALLDPSEYRG